MHLAPGAYWPPMRRHIKRLTPVLWVVALSFVGMRIAGAHVHLCFDGQEQPSTLHLADAGIICHDDGGPAEPHQDRDVDALGTALAKKDAHDHTLDAPVFANAVLALLAPPQGNDSSFVALDTPSVNRPYLHRPQLRGPPR